MKYRVFDGHCDTPVELWMRGERLRKNQLAVSLEQAKHFGGYAQFFAFCTASLTASLLSSTPITRFALPLAVIPMVPIPQ